MSQDRLSQLLNFFKEDPHDPFTIYALALEYTSIDEDKALHYFETLLNDHSTYIPTYYHAAKLYEALDETEKAREIYEKGIQLSKDQNETHALNELQKAYEQFLYNEDL